MMKILELPDDDINRLLALVQREAATAKIYNAYWAEVADRINLCIKAQQTGVFFQCAACIESDHHERRC